MHDKDNESKEVPVASNASCCYPFSPSGGVFTLGDRDPCGPEPKEYLSDPEGPNYSEENGFTEVPTEDVINHPSHYNSDPSGVEAIVICEHKSFCLGNALKYIMRAGLKGGPEKAVEDLKKSVWYLNREIERLSK